MSIITNKDRALRVAHLLQVKQREERERKAREEQLEALIANHQLNLQDVAQHAEEGLYENLIKKLRREWVTASASTSWEKLKARQHFLSEEDSRLLDLMYRHCPFQMQDAFLDAVSGFLSQSVDGVVFRIVRAHYPIAPDEVEWVWCVQASFTAEP